MRWMMPSKPRAAHSLCALSAPNTALFIDAKLHNTGPGHEVSVRKEALTERVRPSKAFVGAKHEFIKEVSRIGNSLNDLGAYNVTRKWVAGGHWAAHRIKIPHSTHI